MKKQEIKPAKGKLVIIKYKQKDGLTNTLSGEITACTKENILFCINKSESEIKLKHKQIIEIIDNKEKLKAYK